MTHYNDNARNALDIDNATKADLNNALLNPLSAPVLKKTSRADLVAMLDTQDAEPAAPTLTDLEKRVTVALLEAGIDCNGAETLDAMQSDNMCVADVAELSTRTSLTKNQIKGVVSSLASKGLVSANIEKPNGEPGVDQWLNTDALATAFDLMAEGIEAKAKKPAPTPADKKPANIGHVYCEPCSDIAELKPIRAGTKRAILAEALARGATIEELCAATGWNRATVQSAFRTDLKPMGYGVHRDAKGIYRLDLPKKAKRPAIRAAGETAEQVMVAACR